MSREKGSGEPPSIEHHPLGLSSCMIMNLVDLLDDGESGGSKERRIMDNMALGQVEPRVG